MHLLRLPTNEKWTKAKKKHLNGTNDSNDNEQSDNFIITKKIDIKQMNKSQRAHV